MTDKGSVKLVPYKVIDTINVDKLNEDKIENLEDSIRILFPNLPKIKKDEKVMLPLGIQAIGAERMWDKKYTGKDILVGIIDTGVAKHSDLEGKVVIRKIYTGEKGEPKNVHATHVAGTIAANGKIKGVAYESKIADYRVLSNQGSGDYGWLIQAIKDAVNDGCHVINMSLGGPVDYKPLKDAMQYAYDKNVPIIVAAGNEGDSNNNTNEYSYPAMYPIVLSVGSTNYNKNNTLPSRFTNSNLEVDCCSQGENVVSTGLNNNYVALSGTSMATPHITGAAALIIQELKYKNETYSTSHIYAKILSYAKDIYLEGKDNSTGYGFITFNNNL